MSEAMKDDEMMEDEVVRLSSLTADKSTYVSVGDVISAQEGFIRGHGTMVQSGKLVATVCGFVQTVNKWISVRPVNMRYQAEVGDVIVGRIEEVGDKRWKVNINGRQLADLKLSAVNLPGDVQRRRTHEDSLSMRQFFNEDDLISAEVQKVGNDGSVMLHTRSIKYGKLEYGQFLSVPAVLIRRSKTHFLSLPCQVDVLMGLNGYLWISSNTSNKDGNEADCKEEIKNVQPNVVSAEQRQKMCRVRNSILALSQAFLPIHAASIMDVYFRSIELNLQPRDMLQNEVLHNLTQTAESRERAME